MDKGPMKHCDKHNFDFMGFLRMCPICRGELMATLPHTPLGPCNIDEQYIPNKTGLYLSQPPASAMAIKPPAPKPVARPVQMELF